VRVAAAACLPAGAASGSPRLTLECHWTGFRVAAASLLCLLGVWLLGGGWLRPVSTVAALSFFFF